MAAPVIIIQGPQGSGKGTQVRLVAERMGWKSFSSGDLWRASAATHLKEKLLEGALGDTDVIIKAVGDYLASVSPETGIISDGFPRKVVEAQWFITELTKLDRRLQLVILIDVPRDESIKRLLNRAKSEGRLDDNHEAINNRLELYETQTKDVIDLWQSMGILKRVDGLGTVSDVAARIKKVVDETKN